MTSILRNMLLIYLFTLKRREDFPKIPTWAEILPFEFVTGLITHKVVILSTDGSLVLKFQPGCKKY